MTDPEARWDRVKQLFQAALDRPPEDREPFLRDTCGPDQALRGEVDSLLLAHAQAGTFADRPAIEAFTTFMAATTDGRSSVDHSLRPGDRVGPYEVADRLGAGGMGEVYRARDVKLSREVAIKVLPPVFTADPERRARLEREARVLAALNHAHIGAIYGLEDVGDLPALVLELVDGPTLAERLVAGPLTVTEALPIAQQIAEALEAAHERGIIHRDLKPGNIKFTRDGAVKVLDFGLAKAGVGDGTELLPAVTVSGMHGALILGTPGYMSPEQATGGATDKRTDIWAFGCVLFEMLAGRRAFEGEDTGDTLAAVLVREPAWHALPLQVPPTIRRLMQRCLEWDPRRRIADVAAVRFVLEEMGSLEGASSSSDPTAVAIAANASTRASLQRVAVFSAVALLVGAALATGLMRVFTRPAPPAVTRTTIAVTGRAAMTLSGLALSPDGTRLVYVGNNGLQLFVRALDALDPVAIAASSIGAGGPFVSPDGQWVGFFEGFTLKKVRMTGGPPITLAQIAATGSRGATWTTDETIILSTSNVAAGLWLVPAGGGPPTALTRPDRARGEAQHLWPERLPGGRAVLFTITAQTGGLAAAHVAVLDLRTRTQKVLLRGGSHAHYVSSGHLVYTAAGTLRAVPFDAGRLEVRGPDVLVLPRLQTTLEGEGIFALAGDGTLVYMDAPGGGEPAAGRTLVWVDRTGNEEPIPAPPRAYLYPRLSPDGTRLALDIADRDRDIWIWDFHRATLTRLTKDPAMDRSPEWTRDGRRIVFTSDRGGVDKLWWQQADGTGGAERLTMSGSIPLADGTTPDGTALIFHERMPPRGVDLMRLALDGSRRVTPLLQTTANARNGIVSPDGRWIAYESTARASWRSMSSRFRTRTPASGR